MAIAWAMVIIQWEYMVLNHPRILDMSIFFLVSDIKILKKKKKKEKKKKTQKTFDRGYMSGDSFAGIHF